MPRGGHNAKPSAIKALTGNPGRRPLNPNEPKPTPGEPAMPTDLDRTGRAVWKRTAPILAGMGVLTEADADLLMLSCHAYAQWRQASAALRQIAPADPTYRKVAFTVEKSRDQMRLLAGELGLSPTSRSRLNIAPQPHEDDPFEQWLRSRG